MYILEMLHKTKLRPGVSRHCEKIFTYRQMHTQRLWEFYKSVSCPVNEEHLIRLQ